ncbi:SH3 domain-containing protein [Wuchereria bancrofti]|uniref:Phosphoinositide phospholipase C n=1 Tax=Wuchereria bancrofti TaxID=6293 RepID=J9FJG0_WUCBA|nr:SH3 domain-containing protein [Wuchereria bancrofti]
MYPQSSADSVLLSQRPFVFTSNSQMTSSSVEFEMEKVFHAMEMGHNVYKLLLMKRRDPAQKRLTYNRETRQLFLSKLDNYDKVKSSGKTLRLDLRIVKEVHTLDFKLRKIKIGDKWEKDKEIKQFDATRILVLSYATTFNLRYWILLFDTEDLCRMWCQGVRYLMLDTISACHALLVERWLRKEFYNIAGYALENPCVAMKHMKPFVQTSLQYKVQSKQLQEVCEEIMHYDSFANAYRKLLHANSLFAEHFAAYSDDAAVVSFNNFLRFHKDKQNDEIGMMREKASDFLRRLLRQWDPYRDVREPALNVTEFCDFLFSRENSLWDSVNENVIHDMNRPLSHYWIASSHNTYLTGDQLKSESSLDTYARALLMGCRCVELDCWDGQKRNSGEIQDIVIYHGYTMTSKINLRDVLYTIRHYAFINSEFPVILSIEDNCSVPVQRLLAREIREILGDYLLTAPVSREETCLPSPAALKRKIILKHKKLPTESESIILQQADEDQEQDLLLLNFTRQGILSLKGGISDEWTTHLFILFPDRLCYMLEQCENNIDNHGILRRQDSLGNAQDDENQDVLTNLTGFGVPPEEMHITEEWFHGKTDRDMARIRLLEHKDKGNGLFLVRDSTIFIGDYSLSFLHNEKVHHCRIRTRMVNGEKKYYFLENRQMDTLYELISHYTKERLRTPNFSTTLVTPCPQPCPHLGMIWFCEKTDRNRAEELLNTVQQDGAFLLRFSSTDKNVFVLSLRVDGEIWHYHLKRDGRIFVVNQTVFENLNQIVEYYSTREFVRGICLKYPVGEDTIIDSAGVCFSTDRAPGCYMELKDIDKEILVRAIESYNGSLPSELSFPINAVINVFRKDGDRWRGKYGGRSGFFPSRCVIELETFGNQPSELGPYATIDLADSLIEEVPFEIAGRPFAFKIRRVSAHWNPSEYVLAANSSEEREDWLNILHELMRTATDRNTMIRTREKNLRIASELSDLVVYCQAVPFNSQFATQGNFYEMCSFSETKFEKLMERGLVQFNARQLSRVYPQGSRVTSANYDPVPMWNAACHMVALNYQTGDRSMQLNQGKFMANGQCGYVLKPSYMIDEMFSPDAAEVVSTSCPIILTVHVVGGQHLSRKDRNRGICSPTVTVEVVGLPADSTSVRTRAIASNGLNPVWNEKFMFKVYCPEIALLRLYVEDGDFMGPKMDPFIGQAVYPLDCIRTGFRSVPLRNQYSEELELSSLLVYLDMRRRSNEAEVLNPHVDLQSSRYVAGGLHKTLTSSGVFSARLNSTDQSNFTVPVSPNLSVAKQVQVLMDSTPLEYFFSFL